VREDATEYPRVGQERQDDHGGRALGAGEGIEVQDAEQQLGPGETAPQGVGRRAGRRLRVGRW
jgi:hypothetical protein